MTSDGVVECITSLIIVHVYDLLISPTKDEMGRLKRALAQFKTGLIFELKKEKQLEYIGLEPQQNDRGSIGMHQTRYISGLKIIAIDVIRNKNWVVHKGRWTTLMNQLVGSLIWVGGTLFDVTDVATALITSMVSDATQIDKASMLLKL